MFETLVATVGNAAHLIGVCLVIVGVLSAVAALERGSFIAGLGKAALMTFLGLFLMKL